MAVLNLIPALILMLVNGPVAPLADAAMPGSSHSVQRKVCSEDEATFLRLALCQFVDPVDRPETKAVPTAGEDTPSIGPSLRPAAAKLLEGFATPGRTRDGPARA